MKNLVLKQHIYISLIAPCASSGGITTAESTEIFEKCNGDFKPICAVPVEHAITLQNKCYLDLESCYNDQFKIHKYFQWGFSVQEKQVQQIQ